MVKIRAPGVLGSDTLVRPTTLARPASDTLVAADESSIIQLVLDLVEG